MSGSLPPGLSQLLSVLQDLVRATYQAGQTDIAPLRRATATITAPQWEYRVISLPLIAADAETSINALAADGWTLFAVAPGSIAIFQRHP